VGPQEYTLIKLRVKECKGEHGAGRGGGCGKACVHICCVCVCVCVCFGGDVAHCLLDWRVTS
jgi:hypothetical protein